MTLKKSDRRTLIILGILVLTALIGYEIYLRQYYTAQFILNPLSFRSADSPVHFVTLGLDDVPPREDETRILVVGDDIPLHRPAGGAPAYPTLLDEMLLDVEVLNLATPHYGIKENALLVEHYGTALRPSLILVGFSFNDLDEEDPKTAKTLLSIQKRLRTPIPILWQGVKDTQRRLDKEDGDEEYDDGDAWLEHYKWEFAYRSHQRRLDAHLAELAAFQEETGTPVVVAITPLFIDFEDSRTIEMHRVVREACDDNGLTCVDLLDPLSAHDASSLADTGDTIFHPNAQGTALIAEVLAPIIQGTLHEG